MMQNPNTPARRGDDSRREFIRKLAYTTPVLLTLPATPALAQVGSGVPDDCVPTPFNDCSPPPPRDEFGCRIGLEVPRFGPDGEFLGCAS